MKHVTTVFSMLSLLTVASVAQAAPVDFYWDNTKGFISAANCQVTTTKTLPFVISEGSNPSPLATENLRTYGGAVKYHLLNRSLLRLAKGGTEKSGYKLVDVLGISETPKADLNRYSAERMDQGYLYEQSTKKLEDYVLELKSGTTVKEIPGIKVNTVGTFWHVASENSEIQNFRCNVNGKSVDHTVFNVYVANQTEAVARVGVQWDQTGIFKSIMTHTTDEADKVLDSRMGNVANNNQSLISASVVAAPSAPLTNVLVAAESLEQQKAEAAQAATTATAPVAAAVEEAVQPTMSGKTAPIPATRPASFESEEEGDGATAKPIDSTLEHIVCVSSDTLAVRNDDLDKVIFRATRNETLLPMQSWDAQDSKKATIGGKEYTFVKVQFPERDAGSNIGWLAQEYVRLEGQCPQPKAEPAPVVNNGPIDNIDSSACCTFPTIKRPTASYLTAQRRFKAGRGGGRSHAACDLYRVHGEKTVAIADGKVLRKLSKFYEGTFALEVRHPGGFIARYGELTGKVATGIKKDAIVKRGQVLGYIGTVNSGCCEPMLHFEMYKGTMTGPLSNKDKVSAKNPFQRRGDLFNGTEYLRKWEKQTFGKSY